MALRTVRSRVPVSDNRRVKPPPKVADPFYSSHEWRQLLDSIIAKRGRQCQGERCGRTGCRLYGDHIIEIKDGGPKLDERNIRLLCGSCHGLKTSQARIERNLT
jgi:5-methylcytosine-specific restriction protein A